MLFQHEEYSIAKYLFSKFAIRVDTSRSQDSLIRPRFRIERLAHNTVNLSNLGYQDISTWIIWYQGSSKADCIAKGDAIQSELKTKHIIPGYLENFVMPIPNIFAVNALGGLLQGLIFVHIAITGLKNGIESLVSPTQILLVVAGNTAARIQFPLIPNDYAQFDQYKVYANRANQPLYFRDSIINHTVNKSFPQTYDLLTASGVTTLPPTTSVIPFGNIFIDDMSVEYDEDELEDGVWDVRITLKTSSNPILEPVDNATLIGTVTTDSPTGSFDTPAT